jgi:hypothetical protein
MRLSGYGAPAGTGCHGGFARSRMVVAGRRFVPYVMCRRCHGLPGFDLAFMKAFQDGRAPWYLRGLIRKPLREIGVILLHDVERCFLGETAMVPGKYPVHRCEQFIGHGYWLSTT